MLLCNKTLCDNNIKGLTSGGGGESCLTPLNPNINKQIVQTVLKHFLKGLFEKNLFHDQSIYSIVIFLIILITFSFYDVVMMLGEDRCWSLKVEAGVAL